jgi:hypothetical protein
MANVERPLKIGKLRGVQPRQQTPRTENGDGYRFEWLTRKNIASEKTKVGAQKCDVMNCAKKRKREMK